MTLRHLALAAALGLGLTGAAIAAPMFPSPTTGGSEAVQAAHWYGGGYDRWEPGRRFGWWRRHHHRHPHHHERRHRHHW